jgi:poly(3-hydroxybutyrate) depolymerase
MRCFLPIAYVALAAGLPILSADILHDWRFNDRSGTALSGAQNSVRAFAKWDGNLANSTITGDGLFRIRRDGSPTSRRMDINAPEDSDELFLVVELDRWNLGSFVENRPEISFDFINAAASARSSQVTAGMRLALNSDNRVVLQGVAGGLAAPGGQSSPEVALFGPAMGRKLVLVTSYSKSRNQYVIHLRVDGGDWFEFFRGTTSGVRNAQSLRMRVNGDFNGRGRNFFDIERIFVSTTFPPDAPISRNDLWRKIEPPKLDEFTFTEWDGPAIRVFYYRPQDLPADAPVMFVLHGVNRDADRYLLQWKAHADQHGFLLIVPDFSQENFPGDEGYILGNFDPERADEPQILSFHAIEPLFDVVRERFENSNEGYYIFGHSAGAQFTHRMIYFVSNNRMIRAITANAGWYTLPRYDIEFPYGLKGTPVDEEALHSTLQVPLTILLGTADTDPNHRFLRNTSETIAQGPNRLARGHNFLREGQQAAQAAGVVFGWRLQEVEGVGHSNAQIAVAAAALLFGEGKGDVTEEEEEP